jgi:hypothetical protein
VGASSLEELGKNLDQTLEETIAEDLVKRQSYWTECLVVGSQSFVEQVQPLMHSRRETEVIEPESEMWALRETPPAYAQKKGIKNGCKIIP